MLVCIDDILVDVTEYKRSSLDLVNVEVKIISNIISLGTFN